MAGARNADVNLIIRARNDADKAINAVGDSLQALLGDASATNTGIGDLGKTLAALDRAAGQIASSSDRAGAALDRQRASIVENKAALAALATQQSEARQILAGYGDQANKAYIGPRTEAFTKNYSAVRAEADRLDGAITRLTKSVGSQEAQIQGAQSSLLKLSATSAAVADGQAAAEAKIELTTRALNEQARAAEQVTAIQQRINDVTGVNRPNTTGSAAAAASVLAAADAEFRLGEARNAAILKLREEEAATRSLAIARENQERFTAFSGITSDPRGAAARSSASVFEEQFAATERAEQAQIDLTAARIADIARLREQEAAATALAIAEENRHRFDRFRGVSADPRGSQARESAAVFIAAADAEAQMEREARRLRDSLDPLAGIQERFNTQLTRYRDLASAGRISTDELAKAESRLADQAQNARTALERAGAANGGRLGLFGLKPYELQNLGYQVNDVVTQLASGTGLTQVLAQQAGQILQLFPRVGGVVIAAIRDPRILAFVATVGSIALGIKHAADEAERLRSYTSTLSFRSDGGTYDAQALSDQQKQLQRNGQSAKDAESAIRSFLDNGVAPEKIAAFAEAADDMADALGIELPEAAKQVAEAFTGGYDAFAKFDDKMNFATGTEREHIRTLYESGRAVEARTEGLRIFMRNVDVAADKQKTTWSQATEKLTNAWDGLLSRLSKTFIVEGMINAFEGLAVVLEKIAGFGATAGAGRTLEIVGSELNAAGAEVRRLQAAVEQGGGHGRQVATRKRELELAQERLTALAAEHSALQKAATTGDTRAQGANTPEAKQRADRIAQIDIEQQLERLRTRGRNGLNAADSARRKALAGEIAYRAEIASSGDATIAARLRDNAAARESLEITKQNAAATKAAAKERERLAKQTRFINPVEGRISSDFGPRRSPGGVGSKFHRGLDFAVPTGTTVRAPAAGVVVETGYDAKLGKYVVIDHGNKVRSKFGHLSDNSIVSQGDAVTQGQRIARTGNTGSATTGAHLHYTVLVNGKPVDPAKGLFATDGPSRFEVNQGEAIQDFEDEVEDAAQRQEKFNLAVRQGAEDRQLSITALRAEAGLHGTALLAEQRKQAVIEAELELRQRLENTNRSLKPGEAPVVITDEQVKNAKDLAATLFDVQHVRENLNARLGDRQRPLEGLSEQRDLLRQRQLFQRSIGEFEEAEGVGKQIEGVTSRIRDAYDELIAFYRALSPNELTELGILDTSQLDIVIAKLKVAKETAGELPDLLYGAVSGQGFLDAFASSAADAFTQFINDVASGENVFESFGRGVLSFAASFASALAGMILKTIAFTAALYALSAITGIPIQVLAAAASVSSSVLHGGGIAGSAGGTRRSISPAVFLGAARYHSGGIAGLLPNEVPAILKRGEEVLTEGDPRHRANGGGKGSGGSRKDTINIINVADHDSAVQQALRTPAGERVLMNFLSENRAAVKAALG